ncbi:MAG TPA: dihydroorotate dehydrogenase [candidate division Zixibacteria bacterium]|jgi:dihydroorotate dehydrogenase (NAD+) catalytic subunit
MKTAKRRQPDLSVTIAGIQFATPVWTASGTAGTGEEINQWCDVRHLGAMVTKSVSLSPRAGHPYPRTVETASGLLNAIGLQNKGIEAFVREELPRLREMPTRVVVNLVGDTQEEYAELARRLSAEDGIDAYELNLSCPNVEKGIDQGADPQWVGSCTAKVRAATERPMIVKLTPNTHDIDALARAAEDAGADAISAINTLVGMAVNHRTFGPRLANVTGGLSGPAVKPVALALVYKIARAVRIPVIGIGGIAAGTDAAEFLIIGASAVQVGTATFRQPDAAVTVADELSDYLQEKGMKSVGELIGRFDAPKPKLTGAG